MPSQEPTAPTAAVAATAADETQTADADAKTWLRATVDAECARLKAEGARAIPLPVKNCGILIDADASSTSAPTASTGGSGGGSGGGGGGTSRRNPRPADVVNRVELDTGMDFTPVRQVMVSPAVPYPHRQKYRYAHVLCFTAASQSTCLLVPYIYAPFLVRRSASSSSASASASAPVAGTGAKGEDDDQEFVAADKHEKGAFANGLQNWLFINNKHQHHRFHVREFHSI